MEKMPRILIVEDDKAIRHFIMVSLKSQSYEYFIAETGKSAIEQTAAIIPDVILLDLGLPDLDGVEVIQRIREWSDIPIIVVSARGNDSDKVKALDMGANDYLTKPFSLDELLARIRVALRSLSQKGNTDSEQTAIFSNGRLLIEYARHYVSIEQQEIHLTPIEYRLLCLLAQNIGKVLTHNYMLKEIWGNYVDQDVQNLRVFMAGLRRKLDHTGEQLIKTHIGVGYSMERLD
jgi:two-component system KDP operon response regulator KdpE